MLLNTERDYFEQKIVFKMKFKKVKISNYLCSKNVKWLPLMRLRLGSVYIFIFIMV